MDLNPALTLLYSCSRFAITDPNEVIFKFVQTGEETCKYLRTFNHIEDLPYLSSDNPNSMSKVDIWGEVKEHLVIFIHGGFWQEGTRKVASPVAVHLVKRDIAVAAVGYEYANSSNTLSKVVEQITTAVEFLLKRYPQAKITLAGHSAGAQLAFKVATVLKKPRIKNLALFAGVFDLTELPFCEIGSAIGMTPGEAKKNSCRAEELAKLRIRVQILIAVKDAPRLVEQNRVMVKEARKLGVDIEAHEFVECDHFSLIQGLRYEHKKQTQELLAFLCNDDA